MSSQAPAPQAPLEAKSPYELRVNMSRDVPQNAVKAALDTGDIGFLHSFTTGSAVDGPGIRLVAWTAGCQWRCQFCHNPDTWSLTNGMPVPVERAVEEIGKYRNSLKVMNGGFTLSGGEPLLQDRFAVRLFAAAKKMGVHTCLNSNGALHDRLSDAELEDIDLVITDIKARDRERHIKLTGKDNTASLEFLQRLAARKRPLWVRLVVIPNLTDDPQEVENTAKFAASLGNVQRVDVLPFHQMGRYKWKDIGLDYKLEEAQPPTPDLIKRVCDQFAAEGLKVV